MTVYHFNIALYSVSKSTTKQTKVLMYTLYFSPGTCSLATQVILRELNVPFQLVNRHSVENYFYINPLGAVPALGVDGNIITEGAAIILHLLKRHPNDLLPNDPRAKDKACLLYTSDAADE